MDCKEFESHIHEYFTNPDFDWWLKRQMNAHYFECDKCFNAFRIAKLLADKAVMADVAKEMGIEKATIRNAIKGLAQKVVELKSKLSFGFSLEPLYAVRGEGLTGDKYPVGESIVLQFEPPRPREGYLIVFHVDNKNNVEVIYPRKADEASLLRADEDRSIIIEAAEPRGKHLVKAILMPVKSLDPTLIPKDKHTVTDSIEEILHTLSEVEEEWAEAVMEFEVV
jgi:hypothetical protein